MERGGRAMEHLNSLRRLQELSSLLSGTLMNTLLKFTSIKHLNKKKEVTADSCFFHFLPQLSL